MVGSIGRGAGIGALSNGVSNMCVTTIDNADPATNVSPPIIAPPIAPPTAPSKVPLSNPSKNDPNGSYYFLNYIL